MPVVSIIMPLYNKEAYIHRAIESVLHQKFSDIELIIVDDGSTDGSADVVKYYMKQDKRIVFIQISNGGVSYARNIGLDHAKGEWIQFLDADDQMDSQYLADAMKILENKEEDIIFSDFWMVSAYEKKERLILSNEIGEKNGSELCECYMRLQKENGFFGYISNKLFKRTLYLNSKARFRTEIKLAEDLDFYVQMYPFVNKAFFVPLCSFYYLQTDENYTHNMHIDYISQIQVQLDIRKWFQQVGMYQKYYEHLDKNVADYIYFSLFHAFEEKRNCSEEYKKVLENREAISCINIQNQMGFSKKILSAVLQKNEKKIERLFRQRWIIRTIYRGIKNGKNIFI